jgi:aryl-alcohol dehydrogenase-like predicted oxidoreductase
MRTHRLGKTGLYVSELCLGTMTYGGKGFWEVIGKLGIDAVAGQLRTALEGGINFIDTADVYGQDGLSERVLGAWLADRAGVRDRLVLATKVRFTMGKGVNASRRCRATASSAASRTRCGRLGTDRIDLYQIHMQDLAVEETRPCAPSTIWSPPARWSTSAVRTTPPIAWSTGCGVRAPPIARASSPCRRSTTSSSAASSASTCRCVGSGAWASCRGRRWPPASCRASTAPPRRRPTAAAWRAGAIAGAGTTRRDTGRSSRSWPAMAGELDVTPAQLALAWLLHKPTVTSVIFGARTVAQLDDNLAAAEVRLAADEVAALDAVSALPPEYPAWMVERQSSDRYLEGMDRA